MSERTIFEAESTTTSDDVAALLDRLADGLRTSSEISFIEGDQTVTMAVPTEVAVSLEVEREQDDEEGATTEVEIELEWEGDTDVKAEPTSSDGESATETFDAASELSTSESKATKATAGASEHESGLSESETSEIEFGASESELDTAASGSETNISSVIGSTDKPRGSLGRFEVYRDKANEWRWRLVHRNGNVIATSGEGYTDRRNAEKGLHSVMANAPGAEVQRTD